MWFDSHCHLFDCVEAGSPEALLDRARAAGVTDLLVAGVDVDTSRRAVEMAAALGVHAAVGIHPNESKGFDDEHMSSIEELIEAPGVVAVGETGLDFYRDASPAPDQRAAFRAHVDLAALWDKAVVVHTRSSVGDALALLEDQGPLPRFVFHCWSGDADELRRAVDLGAFVSFAGNVSFKGSEDLRELARRTPLDRLLVETDAPYLTPAPHRGRPNEPSYVVLVGAAIAEARGMGAAEVAQVTSKNARRLFGLDP